MDNNNNKNNHYPLSSHSMDEEISSKSKLCLKIKFPSTDSATTIREAPPEYGCGDGDSRDSDNQAGHIVCEFCGRRFFSGKAYGGHKRHHLQMKKKNKEASLKLKNKIQDFKKPSYKKNGCATIFTGDVTVKEGKPFCCLCRKIFPSMNSLFGHMKLHPGRAWKESEEDEKPIRFEHIDLMTGLVGWLKKDRRGRVSSTDLIPQAARNLITLSRHGADRPIPSSIFHSSSDMPKKKQKSSSISKILVNNDGEENAEEMESFYCDICKRKFATGQALGGHKRSHWKAPVKPEVFESTGESNVAEASSGEASSNHGRATIDLNQPYVQDGDDEYMPRFPFNTD